LRRFARLLVVNALGHESRDAAVGPASSVVAADDERSG
jgi:hypothetical protein